MRRMMNLKALVIVNLLFVFPLGHLLANGDGIFEPGRISVEYDLIPPEQNDHPDLSQFIVEKNVNLHKFETGLTEGRVALVIHGGPCGPYDKPWAGLHSLGAEYRIIYYHQRGCGKSDGSFTPDVSATYFQNVTNLYNGLGLGNQIADIERIRKIVKKEKITLIGHSFGGFIASLYAAEFPEHVDKMVLVSPADMVVFPAKEDLYQWVEQYLPESLHKEFDDYKKRFFDFGTLFQKTSVEINKLHHEFFKYYYIAQKAKFAGLTFPESNNYSIDWMPFAIYFGLGRNHDYRQYMQQIRAKTLVVHGQYDLQPESVSKNFCTYIDSSLCKYAGIGEASHFPFVENPNDFQRAVETFLVEKK